ncbi:unnamed protein product [Acanthoscelides obtectus]|uniref:Uncharacterized protein n=1 Tax=Acanthoscelides obtectus TaxID=200917 RepID=A0A9P0MDZ6_ACAOB|nr:unnamed protein product [Acanthoscelides obtectus]CAK1626692.1 hypothetical protein AOBTE_LOCUS4034 [Acanthoscelides obtectus]
MNYAVANSEGVFIREESFEDDDSLIDEYDYHVGQKRRLFESPRGNRSKRRNSNDNEHRDIEDIFYPRDILSKIKGDIDENRGTNADSDLVKKCSKLDDKEWRKMILDVAELVYCNQEMLDFELRTFRTQLMPQTYLRKNLLQKKAEFCLRKLKSNER